MDLRLDGNLVLLILSSLLVGIFLALAIDLRVSPFLGLLKLFIQGRLVFDDDVVGFEDCGLFDTKQAEGRTLFCLV